ncbi:MAG: SDR family oxidoreductase, partial [Actinomycetota bacterium]|nr:SDR family oxidoreductase [Actinomycetota bacterium]
MILAEKKILVTGVVNRHSIAYAIAERAQQQGAEVILTSFGRVRRMTERAAKRLPDEPEVLELDINSDQDLEALTDSLRERWDRLDGAVHAIAYAPPDALGGNFLSAPRESAKLAFETSAYSLKALAGAVAPLMSAGTEGGAASSNGVR